MWKLVPMSDDRKYVLNLCQDTENRRYCVITEAGIVAPHAVFQTEPVAIHILRNYESEQVERHTQTTDSRKIAFGPHGEWLVGEEVEAWDNDDEFIPWVTKHPPESPPK
jgi:hypothetical protein